MVVILSQNVLHEVFNTGLPPRQVAWEHLLTFSGTVSFKKTKMFSNMLILTIFVSIDLF